ncbi:MAG: arginase, partial [Treponema sp.]|nr:arginase [Treponema sp.]
MSIHILEMPLDFGGNRHGSDMGPSAIRLAGLKDRLQKLGL